jgi:hypothetical protein
MTENEMLHALQGVWENMTMDKDRAAYGEMLVLLDNMTYFLRHDLQCEYPKSETVRAGAFDF